MGSLPQPLNPSISAASSSTPPSLSASVNPSNLIDASQTTPSPTKLSSSNMNNDLSTQNGRAKRNKRDSRKKREAKGTLEGANDAPREKKSTTSSSSSAIPASELTMLMPIQLADPRPSDVLSPKPRQMNFAYEKYSEVLGQSWKFYEIADKLSNRNGFRYTYAAMDPSFPHIKYRQTDVPPYYSRFSFEDSPAAICFTEDGLAVTTNEPWHSARANVCAREGSYYYEARVISGIVKGSQHTPSGSPRGNVRLGFARREADLDVNVGVDCYGYGIRDVNGEVVNRMRCEYFFPKEEAINEGDVIGMLITLPPLWQHRKIVEGTYDSSIDGDGSTPTTATSATTAPLPPASNLIRDRIPFHLKTDFLYQQSHIFPSKHLRDYAFNLKETPTYGVPSPTNTEDPSLRTLPGSSITIFKNGAKMGTPFRDLYAFLPPASRATQASNNLGVGTRENADDGMIGYFPIVSCHGGGAVEARFEGPWWVGPPSVNEVDGIGHGQAIKGFGERYGEQVVEDVLADIVDEIEATFMGWGGDGTAVTAPTAAAAATTVDMAANASDGASVAAAAGVFTDDGGSVSVSIGTPQQGSVAGETVMSEDVEMGM
ncbi:Set1 complex component [Histoplasma capsulatum G186AR]|uniref:Set1 complex component n=1 Tax=Ajellomyces capsulatus TaxID=5037 RepID=A0A8H8D0X3_AJECA|nr:Set1 complex component [Histoplasma capsulatum]QSS73831.1 Set1 complex component [Histoplasma capsulatum G186AR]